MIVVDASLFLAWLLNEPGHAPDDGIWETLLTNTIVVPAHWPNEIANGLRRAVRTKRMVNREIAPIAERIAAFDVSYDDAMSVSEIAMAANESLSHDISVYDLLYLRLAQRHDLPLATLDRPMRRVAQRMNIALLPAKIA